MYPDSAFCWDTWKLQSFKYKKCMLVRILIRGMLEISQQCLHMPFRVRLKQYDLPLYLVSFNTELGVFRNLWALTSARKAFRCSRLRFRTQKPKLVLEPCNMDSRPTPEALKYPELQPGYFVVCCALSIFILSCLTYKFRQCKKYGGGGDDGRSMNCLC